MMSRVRQRDARGFTLIELMIVVAIIGILASIAVPSFVRYQNRSKRAEAYSNLASLARAQKAYFAENNNFQFAPAEPMGLTGIAPTTFKRDSTGWDTTPFGVLGWQPDGDVYYDYDVNIQGGPGCACTMCFTAGAYGDLDGDGLTAVLIYSEPDRVGGLCPGMLVPTFVGDADSNGVNDYNMVVRVLSEDDF